MAPFPYRKVVELREKYTYDIHPFSTFGKDNSDERSNGRQGILVLFFTERFSWDGSMTEKNVLFFVNKPGKFLFLDLNHEVFPMIYIISEGVVMIFLLLLVSSLYCGIVMRSYCLR